MLESVLKAGVDVRLKTVDLFCGLGGSSEGARMAGAEIVAAIDADPLAIATFKDNFPQANAVVGRLDEINGTTLLRDVADVDLLLASPECTNHSVARGNKKVDPVSLRSGLFILPFIKTWRPRFLVLENVSRMRRWEGWSRLIDELKQARYHHSVVILDAQNFGVPQARRRMFLLAARDFQPPLSIPATITRPLTAAGILDRRGTHPAKPIFGRPRPLARATIARIMRGRAAIPDKDFIIVYYGSDAAGGWQALNRPLRTLTTLDRFGLVSSMGTHTTLRMLQVPELKRAMGFPSAYKLNHGTRRDRIRLLGNAVCPSVMAAIVKAVTAAMVQSKDLAKDKQLKAA